MGANIIFKQSNNILGESVWEGYLFGIVFLLFLNLFNICMVGIEAIQQLEEGSTEFKRSSFVLYLYFLYY